MTTRSPSFSFAARMRASTSASSMSANCWSASALADMSITCSRENVDESRGAHPPCIDKCCAADLPSRRFTLKRNVPREYATPALLRGLLPFPLAQPEAELAQMSIGHRRRGRSEQARGRLGLWKSHDVADRARAAHE